MSHLRRNLYEAARLMGDAEAASKGPSAYVKRRVRRKVYRTEGQITRHSLKKSGSATVD
jgi:hypothetical protein